VPTGPAFVHVAAVGILRALNVPIVYMSVRWWRTLHQIQSSPATVDNVFVLALRLNVFAFLFMMIYFVRRRYEAACLVRATERSPETRRRS
jgi:heme exporter protein C